MSAIFTAQELAPTDRSPLPAPDIGLVSLGAEFDWDDGEFESDTEELDCLPMLAADLPLNSEIQGRSSAAHR